MANQTTGNPKVFDSASGATIPGTFKLALLQWVDDNQDVADGGNFVFDINTVTLEATVQRNTTDTPGGEGAVLWQIGPFSPPMLCRGLTISTLSAGHVHVWVS